jgi:ABC-type sugar transport system permease subunit
MRTTKTTSQAMIPKKTKSRLMERKNMVGYVFTLPFLIGLVLIFIPALCESLIYSVSNVVVDFNSIDVNLAGFMQYIYAFTVDVKFAPMLAKAIQGMLLDLVVIIFFSFFIANVLNQKFLGRGFARTIFFLPVLLATGIIAAADTNNMAMSFFSSSTNTGSTIASAFSGGTSSFFDLKGLLESANISSSFTGVILYAIDNTYSIVNSSGVQILIFISALQSIPPSIFEASKVEGATKWEEFWKITFPMLTPMILVNIVYTIIDSFANPKYEVLNYIQNIAFSHKDGIAYSSALAWVYFSVILVVLGLICGIVAKRIQYLD